jgi:hypothetical protein
MITQPCLLWKKCRKLYLLYSYKRIYSTIGYIRLPRKWLNWKRWFEMYPRLSDHYNLAPHYKVLIKNSSNCSRVYCLYALIFIIFLLSSKVIISKTDSIVELLITIFSSAITELPSR